MTVFLIRHAKAEDASPDAARRLTTAGRSHARALGKILGRSEAFAAMIARRCANWVARSVSWKYIGGICDTNQGTTLSAVARKEWASSSTMLVASG